MWKWRQIEMWWDKGTQDMLCTSGQWSKPSQVPAQRLCPITNHLSFPQKLALPDPLGTRKWSLGLACKYTSFLFKNKLWVQWGGRHSWNRQLKRQHRNCWAGTETNSLPPGLPQTASHLGSLQGRQVHKVTTPVPLHCQGNGKTNTSLEGEEQPQQAASPGAHCTVKVCPGQSSSQRLWELRLCVLPETGQDLAAASPEQKLLPWETSRAWKRGKAKGVFLQSAHSLQPHKREHPRTARPGELRWGGASADTSFPRQHQLCQGPEYRHFTGVFLKQRPPWGEGSYCHSCRLKDVPLSSDTAASLGLNSDLVWCPLRYFPRL